MGEYFVPKRGLEGVTASSGFDPTCFRPLLLPLSLNPSDIEQGVIESAHLLTCPLDSRQQKRDALYLVRKEMRGNLKL